MLNAKVIIRAVETLNNAPKLIFTRAKFIFTGIKSIFTGIKSILRYT